AVATVETTWEPAARYLRNGVRVNSVSANLEKGYSFSQALDGLYAALEANPLPEGTRLELGGDAEGSSNANSALLAVAPIGMLLSLSFLLLQISSLRRVGVILLIVPLAIFVFSPGLVLL